MCAVGPGLASGFPGDFASIPALGEGLFVPGLGYDGGCAGHLLPFWKWDCEACQAGCLQ